MSKADARIDLLFTMSDSGVAAGRWALRRRKPINHGRCGLPAGGARRDRTDDLLLAKQALSQLSYGPDAGHGSDRARMETGSRLDPSMLDPAIPIVGTRIATALTPDRGAHRGSASTSANLVGLGRLERPTSPLSGVRSNHLSYRPESLRPRAPHGGPRSGKPQPIRESAGSSAKKEKRRRRCPA